MHQNATNPHPPPIGRWMFDVRLFPWQPWRLGGLGAIKPKQTHQIHVISSKTPFRLAKIAPHHQTNHYQPPPHPLNHLKLYLPLAELWGIGKLSQSVGALCVSRE